MTKIYLLGKEIISDSQLETWATPRLLRYYKSMRKVVIGRHRDTDYYPDTRGWTEFPLLQAYVDKLKSMLDKREHVAAK